MTKQLLTQIINPVLPSTLGQGAELNNGASGGTSIIAQLIVTIWQTLLTLGGILVIFWFIYGGITWLTAGGDKQKVDNARNRIMNALIGMILLFSTFAVINYLGPAIGFDLLRLNVPTPTNMTLPPLDTAPMP